MHVLQHPGRQFRVEGAESDAGPEARGPVVGNAGHQQRPPVTLQHGASSASGTYRVRLVRPETPSGGRAADRGTVQGIYLAGRQGKRGPVRKGSLSLAGEHDCTEQVQPVVPLGGQQGRRVITRQRPVPPRVIRVGLRCGKRRDKLGDL